MTEIVFILDKSGSMNSIKSDAIGGFNQFLNEQKEIKDDTTMSLFLFDSNFHKVYENIPLNESKEITEEDYKPSSMTALYDAIGYSIESISQRKKEEDRTLFVIITDGDNNSSKKYTRDAVFEMIEDCKKNNCEFIFLAANQDAFTVSSKINVSTGNTMNFLATTDGMSRSYAVSSMATKMYRSKSAKSSDLISSAVDKIDNK